MGSLLEKESAVLLHASATRYWPIILVHTQKRNFHSKGVQACALRDLSEALVSKLKS